MREGKMKKYLILLIAIIFTTELTFSQTPLPPASKPDAELLKKEAEARILDFKSRIETLQAEFNNLDDQINKAKTELDQLKSQFKDCRKEILTLIGASESDLDAFRQKLGVIEGKVRQLKGLSNDALADRQAEVKALEDELAQNKAALAKLEKKQSRLGELQKALLECAAISDEMLSDELDGQ